MSVATAASATDGPVASASKLNRGEKRQVRNIVRSYINRNRAALRGPVGPQGATGPQGPKGDKGDPGTPGGGGGGSTAVATKIDFRVRQNTSSTVLYNFQGLEVRADCSATGAMTVTFRTSTENSQLDSWVRSGTDLNADDFDVGDVENFDVIDTAGTISYTDPTGKHVSIVFHAEDVANGPPLGGTSDCFFGGIALTG